jgi:hypothetical protein
MDYTDDECMNLFTRNQLNECGWYWRGVQEEKVAGKS